MVDSSSDVNGSIQGKIITSTCDVHFLLLWRNLEKVLSDD